MEIVPNKALSLSLSLSSSSSTVFGLWTLSLEGLLPALSFSPPPIVTRKGDRDRTQYEGFGVPHTLYVTGFNTPVLNRVVKCLLRPVTLRTGEEILCRIRRGYPGTSVCACRGGMRTLALCVGFCALLLDGRTAALHAPAGVAPAASVLVQNKPARAQGSGPQHQLGLALRGGQGDRESYVKPVRRPLCPCTGTGRPAAASCCTELDLPRRLRFLLAATLPCLACARVRPRGRERETGLKRES